MSSAYERAARRAVAWLADRLEPDGSFRSADDDLGCYYKAPYLFSLAGHPAEANRLLTRIQSRFGQHDHDFLTGEDAKSANPALEEFWAYPNGWITMAAQRMGRFDVAHPAFRFLRWFHQPATGGFRTRGPKHAHNTGTDALSTAHLGLVALYFDDMERAEGAGHWLAETLAMQPDLDFGLYLRRDGSGALVRDFPADATLFHLVSATEPEQAYFMVGYPMAFLAALHRATGNPGHLDAAWGYLDFALRTTGNIRRCHNSHKVAWGAAALARTTGDQDCLALATDVADHLLSTQDASGAWLADQPALTVFDQTAEVAIWLLEISAALDGW
ncbi:hypothetical protein LX15_002244 [Streptoalloteichus tenebrarius]|uniref:Uncharacterized protein n=1 Tax=Streptoalloteichus tenebrarius (strain ATCC 17920 / DSM 40477 / JCM 4838 / CBS 697.72 / NBRC 16177 / NCIMB 11028 / NRRL B-12390 / A12253. 1 / ISP 5477) TaxID=1933 RepID=A0ABT1HSS7_STRSD|nr:hypothetical protein [Streptoalloteichus tenebrarius]MCP2258546.1 hypothetical protein [Streptoalloteichus tenebrarius]BFF04087.1 hypothetical protein GCM10020241_57620 [Streptoalloteichus tenebrarius]